MPFISLNSKHAIVIVLTSLILCVRHASFEIGTCPADSGSVSCGQSQNDDDKSNFATKRYLLYEVNPGEGFNLRRDVYMRIATLAKKLNQDSKHHWILVLPPWGPLYHWKSKNIGYQAQIKWSKFFDISSLKSYVSVMEFEDFLKENGPKIDVLYYLQHYAEGWTDGKWEEKVDIRECTEPSPYWKENDDKYVGWFWGYDNVFALEFHCLSVQGYSSTLKKFISKLDAKVVMIDRAETILHDTFGDAEYWMVRKSMVFAKHLITIGDNFRKKFLNSSDTTDKTEKRGTSERTAVGGPYIGAHLRRLDFVTARSKEVPSLKHAANQIKTLMKKWNLNLVFVATDASQAEFIEFQQYIPSAVRFIPDPSTHKDLLDGGVAIVDQWICAHAGYFIGTYESTFSFRIQEEREILGFPVEMTFNRLCGDNQTTCPQPSKWTIVHK